MDTAVDPKDRMVEKLDELDLLLEQTQTLIQSLLDENEVLQRDLALAIAKIEELERA